MYDQRAQLLKWLLVTCFGYTGYRNARFGRIECHEAINAPSAERYCCAPAAWPRSGGSASCTASSTRSGSRGTGTWTRSAEDVEREVGIPLHLDGIYKWIVFLPIDRHRHRGAQPLLRPVRERGAEAAGHLPAQERHHPAGPFAAGRHAGRLLQSLRRRRLQGADPGGARGPRPLPGRPAERERAAAAADNAPADVQGAGGVHAVQRLLRGAEADERARLRRARRAERWSTSSATARARASGSG